ncbi:MAG: hypothetical protein AVDCRST_MAG08-2241 [uncultured Acetobacteraceae bacterium]|uniref:Uncharacterized protein n=1 Tax=uncultured Acetobacteraceae bacterium TaxID=169975 RepID=A0A6J4IJN2_9PROT|nr:MAG: hypothetical protein AVDCRST_MAG08-2241 [uncultured Acetobacteraceae bacterium]
MFGMAGASLRKMRHRRRGRALLAPTVQELKLDGEGDGSAPRARAGPPGVVAGASIRHIYRINLVRFGLLSLLVIERRA